MKRLLIITIGIFCGGLLLLSLVILLKPGASFFYKKYQIKNLDLIQVGHAYEIQFKANQSIYDPETILILEDNKVLAPGTPESIKSGEAESFSVETIQGDQITVIFTPSTLPVKTANGHTYRIYIRPYLIKGNFGWSVLLLGALGLVAIFEFNLVDLRKRKRGGGSSSGKANVRGDEPGGTKEIARPFFKTRTPFLKNTIVNCILFTYLYVFLEWLFFVTKPSFMDSFSPGGRIKVLLIACLAVTLITLLVLIVIFLLDGLIAPVFPSFYKYAYVLPVVFILTCLGLILIDNFTYTVFKFGIVNSRTLVRAAYGVVFEGGFIYILIRMAAAMTSANKPGSQRIKTIGAISLVAVSFLLAGFSFKPESIALPQIVQKSKVTQKPNIILMSTDGLNADDMSVYGYARDTTPFLRELAKSSLVGESNYTNAHITMGSIVSVLTGKLPFSSHVIYPPNTLQGANMYQHLPGLLKQDGYYNAQMAVKFYTDANALNFKDAFDSIDCVDNPPDPLASSFSRYGYDDEVFFMTTIIQRISDRIEHIFFIKDMQNPYTLVTQPNSFSSSDQGRFKCLRSYLSQAKQTGQPVFVQLHLLGTHGPKFYPSQRVFSKNEIQNNDWMTDFHDDSVLSFDSDVQQFVQYLKDNGQYENTILILFSDHGEEWTATNRIPLIIHFPGDQHAGTIKVNTQNIDIAPTILDYLGIEKPDWMDGDSILGNLASNRLIISGASYKTTLIGDLARLSQDEFKPPFYQFSELLVTQCNNQYDMNLDFMTMTHTVVKNNLNVCSADMQDSPQTIRKKVGNILKQLGYHLPPNW